ncbi:MAG: sigma-70 family RNA polymerase sigma factor [Luteitalea sp.]|nr:sigma-70 family RNA polymerase sigma factor [Luteitalea sp.]
MQAQARPGVTNMTTDPAWTSAPRDAQPLAPEATVELLNRLKGGDDAALETLLQRCIPALRRWARGRLPQSARGMLETADLVQDAVLASVRRLEAFEARHQGALQAYFRQAVMNRIRDIVRQQQRRPQQTELPEHLVDERTSPLQLAIGSDNLARYDAAIQRLKASDREAIIGRIELQYSYEELAVVLNKPSPDAARVAVRRAMKRLADEMRMTAGQPG